MVKQLEHVVLSVIETDTLTTAAMDEHTAITQSTGAPLKLIGECPTPQTDQAVLRKDKQMEWIAVIQHFTG